MTQALLAAIPTFKLYGETRPWAGHALLHCELICERSSLHGWHIANHRHGDLVHIVYLRSGSLNLHLEGGDYHVEGPCVMLIPAMAIHGFQLQAGVDGYSLAVVQSVLEQLDPQGGRQMPGGAYPLAGRPQARALEALFGLLHDEYVDYDDGKDSVLRGLLQALFVQVMRRVFEGAGQRVPNRKGQHYLARFQLRVEQCFRQHPGIETVASELGITGTYLNLLCQRLTGCSALQVLHGRIMLEARRLLIYTPLTIGQVADDLGFEDPAYFSRFFKRHAGVSPKAFRLQRH